MSISVNPAYAHCPRQNCAVFLGQTEGQCREKHNCSGEACPLEAELGHNRFQRALQTLSASIGLGFAETPKTRA